MTERASKPAEPGKPGPTHLETVEFEPGAFNDLAPEDIERLKRGEALPPRAPLPVAGGDKLAPVIDATDIQGPLKATAYEAPRDLPNRTNHSGVDMESVAVEPDVDPRKVPTQRKLRSPIEKDTIRDLVRREPTLRGLHAGAPGADEAPPSAGPAPVVVPGPETPEWADEAPASERGVEPPARPPTKPRGIALILVVLAIAGVVGTVIALRSPDPVPAPRASAVEPLEPPEPVVPATQTAPVVTASVESASPATPAAAAPAAPTKRIPAGPASSAPALGAKPRSSAPSASPSPPAAPSTDNPFGPSVF